MVHVRAQAELPEEEGGEGDGDEQAGEQRRAGEEEGGVLLHPAGLDLPEHLAAAVRDGAGPVDRAVDEALVEHASAKQLIAAEPDEVKTLVIKTGGQEYTLSREGGDWLVDGDSNAKADAARVNMFVTRAVRLQAEKIVTEKPSDLKPYGLASPTAELIAAGEQGKLLGRINFGRQKQGLAYALGSAMPGVFQVRPDILQDIPKKDELIAAKTQPKK